MELINNIKQVIIILSKSIASILIVFISIILLINSDNKHYNSINIKLPNHDCYEYYTDVDILNQDCINQFYTIRINSGKDAGIYYNIDYRYVLK